MVKISSGTGLNPLVVTRDDDADVLARSPASPQASQQASQQAPQQASLQASQHPPAQQPWFFQRIAASVTSHVHHLLAGTPPLSVSEIVTRLEQAGYGVVECATSGKQLAGIYRTEDGQRTFWMV